MKKLVSLMVALSCGIAFAQKIKEKPVAPERTDLIKEIETKGQMKFSEKEVKIFERDLSDAQITELRSLSQRFGEVETSAKRETVDSAGKPVNLARVASFGVHEANILLATARMMKNSPNESRAVLTEMVDQQVANLKEFMEAGDIGAMVGLTQIFNETARKQEDVIIAKSKAPGIRSVAEQRLARINNDISNMFYNQAREVVAERLKNLKLSTSEYAKRFADELNKLLICLRGQGRGLKRAS